MPEAELGRIAELADGVFALSCLVDLRQPVSWVAPGTSGFDPSTCYLIIDGDEAHLIDTGLRACGPTLIRQLSSLVPTSMPLHVALTRVEPDCLGNLDLIAERMCLVRISSQSNVIPLDYLGPISGRYPGVAINNGLHPEDRITFGAGRRLLVVNPAVRTLPTLWYHDEASGVLFTSDFFGHVHVAEAEAWTPTGEAAVDHVRAHLLAKFDWLKVADTSPLVDCLDAIFSRLDVRAIAPGHGLWTMGPAQVRRCYEVTRSALLTVGRGGVGP